MTITLSGANSFALDSELKTLVDEFVAKEGAMALNKIDGQEASFEQIVEALNGLPFLSSKKIIVLRLPSTNKQFVEQAEQIIDNLPESNQLIIVEPKLDKRLSYYKYLKKATDFRDFPELDINGLSSWLSQRASTQKGNLSSADARYLVQRVGLNQQLLASELDKLLLYDTKITRQSIDLLTEPTPQSTVFELLEAAFAGNQQRALKLYDEQRAQKVEPVQIIAMLTWQLHVLAIIKTAGDRQAGQIASEAKINPYVLQKSQSIARDLSYAELKNLVKDLSKIDIGSKSTNLDADEALKHYLLKLAN